MSGPLEHGYQGMYPKCYVLVEGYDGDFAPPHHVCQTLEAAKFWLIGEARAWAIKESGGKDNILHTAIQWQQLGPDDLVLIYKIKFNKQVWVDGGMAISQLGVLMVTAAHNELRVEELTAPIQTILTVDFGDEQLT